MKQDQEHSQPKTTKGPLLFRTIKKFASKVKNTLTELGGIHSVHKYTEGEIARYKVGKVPKTLVQYDAETKTVEGTCCSNHVLQDIIIVTVFFSSRLADICFHCVALLPLVL